MAAPFQAAWSIELGRTARRAVGLEPLSMYDDGRDVLAFQVLLVLLIAVLAYAVSEFGARDVFVEAPQRALEAAGGAVAVAAAHAVDAASLLKGGAMHVYYAAVGRRPFSPYGAAVPPRGARVVAPPQKKTPTRPKNGQARSSAQARAAPNGPASSVGVRPPAGSASAPPISPPGGGASSWLPWGSAPRPGPRPPSSFHLAPPVTPEEREQLERARLFHEGRCGGPAPDKAICGGLLGRFAPDDVPERNPDGTPANVRAPRPSRRCGLLLFRRK